MFPGRNRLVFASLAFALLLAASSGLAADLRILLPLGRTAYQTNEWIDLAVVRSSDKALSQDNLQLTLDGSDGSRVFFTLPVPAAARAPGAGDGSGEDARRTETLRLNGWLLRPGRYAVEAKCDGATAKSEFALFSHVRKTTFKLIDWGNVKGAEHEVMGEDSVGYNLMYGQYRRQDALAQADASIRGGLDYMQVCTMGGAHQLDMRIECDWSDPYTIRGGSARLSQQAFIGRTTPNCAGVHFYDEPGLTWHKHPVTGEWTPHGIPSQVRAFKSAFGRDPVQYNEVKPDSPDSLARWEHWGRWKLGFVEAAWKLGRFDVEFVRPDYIAANQTQYGWYASADGYYFNVARSLPVISGHGGYDDMPLGYLHPSYFFEFGRARDLDKPAWYLPTWYDGTPSAHFRLEQYLSFMTNLQGMMTPPGMRMQQPSKVPGAEGIVESNRLMARLGTIFDTMPVTRPDVAVLYSLSQCLRAQSGDMTDNYGGSHRDKLMCLYAASKMIQVPMFPIVEEDVLDGTLAANHRAVVLAGIDYLPREVLAGLQDFAADGGIVLVTDDSRVRPRGMTLLGCAVDDSLSRRLTDLWKAGQQEEVWKLNLTGKHLDAARPLAMALAAKLRGLGIPPVFACEEVGRPLADGIAAWRQAEGDIEYLFAANIAYDYAVGGKNSLRATVATITVPSDGRPIYDAVRGGEAREFGRKGSGLVRFGPGQMRVFARTARPIGGVQALTPAVSRDLTRDAEPIRLEIGATLVDDAGRVLAGSAPLHVQVFDPLGALRHDLYRATKLGQFRTRLPLAANDPAGPWRVVVHELLTNRSAAAAFAYSPAKRCGAVAGVATRALFFGRDRDNVYRFFRTHHDVTIVTGKGEYAEAASRLAEALKPWDVRCTVVAAADVKPRPIADDEAPAWAGLQPSRVKPGPENNPVHVGFDVRGAAILLGTPKDNPLIAFLEQQGFLPYAPTPDFPGRGRGLVAWQRDAVAYERESITLIAFDAEGMNEAVGSLYEAAAGLTPLTPCTPATENTVAVASRPGARQPAPAIAWQTVLPDRAVALRSLAGGYVLVLTQDGSLTLLSKAGRESWQRSFPGGEAWCFDTTSDGDASVVGASQRVLAFSGRGKQLFDAPASATATPQTVTFVAVAPSGARFAVGTTDGKLALLGARGERFWTIGGVPEADLARWDADAAKWKDDLKRWEAAAKEWDEKYKDKPGEKPPKPKRPDEPKKPLPEPYIAGTFGADGRTLVALTAKEAHAANVANGQIVARIEGVNGTVALSRLAGNLLLSDGRRTVAWLSPDDARLVSRVAMPTEGVVSLAVTGDGFVVGTEADGTVRKLKSIAGRADEQIVWEHKVPQRLVKKVVATPAHVAVACWGGTVHILNATGMLTGAHLFRDDVADMAWAEDTLVVALADGRIVALEGK